MNFLPVTSRLRARLISPLPLLEIAEEVCELEPGSTFECPPPISLPGELDRVTAFEGEAKAQIKRLHERTRVEGPTLSYRLPNAILADFTVYCGDRYRVFRPGHKRAVLFGAADEFEQAQLCTTSCAESYFGHFLREALPLELLAKQREMSPLGFRRQPWLHENEYRRLLHMESSHSRYARVANLWITDERTLNSGWVSRYEELRARLRASTTPAGGEPVFIRRGVLGDARNLQNEDELCDNLTRLGFRIITPEAISAEDIAGALLNSRLVVCVEGSAQQHAFLAMPSGGAIVSIQPPRRFNTIAKIIADRIGVQFVFHVAEETGDGFRVDFGRLQKTLDLIQ
jgi:capsular polysaccharide biosynthesis protein